MRIDGPQCWRRVRETRRGNVAVEYADVTGKTWARYYRPESLPPMPADWTAAAPGPSALTEADWWFAEVYECVAPFRSLDMLP